MASRAFMDELMKLLQGNIQFNQKFSIGRNIRLHLQELEIFFEEQKIMNQDEKARKLINSLEDDAKFELQSLPEFKAHSEEYDWLKERLCSLYHQKKTKIMPIVNILNIKQQNMMFREYLSTVRIAGYMEMADFDDTERERMLISIF